MQVLLHVRVSRTERSMPPIGGMMPLNSCRKGSVSCGTDSIQGSGSHTQQP
jgi:hypothetical protein